MFGSVFRTTYNLRMAFTVNDFRDLVALLEARPDWRAELRRLILPEELPRLPEVVRQVFSDTGRTAPAR